MKGEKSEADKEEEAEAAAAESEKVVNDFSFFQLEWLVSRQIR